VYDWDETPELNITPLVDVMLVLLAILMVTAPTMVYEEMINLPQGSATKRLIKKQKVEIRIDKDRVVSIGANKFNFFSFDDNFMLHSRTISKGSIVLIAADKSLRYSDVMHILSSVKRAGFTQVSLATDG